MPHRHRLAEERRRRVEIDRRPFVFCLRHSVDLAALSHFVSDGRPLGDAAALRAIGDGGCPACRPEYMAARPDDPVAWEISARACACCRALWSLEGGGWVAEVSDGLGVVGSHEPVPSGSTIDSHSFRVAPFDGSDGFLAVLRTAFSRPGRAESFPLEEMVIDDLAESMAAVVRGKADFDGELGRIVLEYQLSPEAASAWTEEARAAVSVASAALSEPAKENGCPICADPLSGVQMTRERFEALVADAIDALPPELGSHMENVAVVVEDRSPDGQHLAGVFRGVPLTSRRRYSGVPPDRITIFQETICRHADSERAVEEEVTATVIHEIAHHFGIDDATLERLGW